MPAVSISYVPVTEEIRKKANKYFFSKVAVNALLMILGAVLIKQKTAYEMCVGDWSSDVCSSDLKTAKETQMYRTVFWTLWERERVG